MFTQHIHSSLAGVVLVATIGIGAEVCFAGGDVVWPAGSTQSVISDLHLTSTLIVEEGVTVNVNPGVSIFIESGGHIVVNGTADEPVLFTGNGPQRWDGIWFDAAGEGDLSHAIIEHTNEIGVYIEGASPSLDSCIIRDVRGTMASTSARGLWIFGNGANPTISRCLIENVVGINGAVGSNAADQGNAPDGADGTFFAPNADNGGTGNNGGIGGTGAQGGWAYGIIVEQGALATLVSNHVRLIDAGDGGAGGSGGDGGNGGDGGTGANGIFVGSAGIGGNGGNGGTGGTGGPGGWAFGIRLWDLPSDIVVTQNLVEQVLAANGGFGGFGGSGGDGGNGGPGWDIIPGDVFDTDGGDGGDAGDAGNGGSGGVGGTARAFDVQNGTAEVLFVQNTVAALSVGPGGGGGIPGFAGQIGFGGNGGPGASDGAAGASGSTGSSGPTGQAGTRHGAFATTSVDLVLTNNIISFGGGSSGTALVTSGSGTINAGSNCLFGFASLSEGSVTVQPGNILLDPLFIDPADFDFRLSSQSPAIDAGSNAAVPVDLLEDLDGLDRSVDGDENGSTIVDMGAYEFQTQVPCLADLSNDGSVGPADLGQLLASWGSCKGCAADFNGDNNVGPADLAQLLASWGTCG